MSSFEDRIHGMTTLLEVEYADGLGSGSGFFFGTLAPGDGTNAPEWRAVQKIWVVTNKHVLCPPLERPRLPIQVTVGIRQVLQSGVDWCSLTYQKEQLRQRIRLHPDPRVDVAGLDVTPQLLDFVQKAHPVSFSIVAESDLPGCGGRSVEVGDTVLVIGYPRGWYDRDSKFPVVKMGVLASRWGACFHGDRCCAIDARLFPGSSGSLVIKQPSHLRIHQGQPQFSSQKEICVVGVYSGEPYELGPEVETEEAFVRPKEFCDLGIVWHPSTIMETVSQPSSPFARRVAAGTASA